MGALREPVGRGGPSAAGDSAQGPPTRAARSRAARSRAATGKASDDLGKQPQAQRPSGPWRVLIVDDYPDAALTLQLVLQSCGWEAAILEHSADALALARSFRPDTIVLDLAMPAPDGFDLARQIRSDRSFDGTTIIAVSGLAFQGDREKALAAGFDHFFAKPVDSDALIQTIERIAPEARCASQVHPR